jgi:hypothetical protein
MSQKGREPAREAAAFNMPVATAPTCSESTVSWPAWAASGSPYDNVKVESFITEVRLPRRRRGQNSSQVSKEVIDTVRDLSLICSDKIIAAFLNRNGLLTGRGNRWTRDHVTALRSYHQIPCHSADAQAS